jgi:hypothetical protein
MVPILNNCGSIADPRSNSIFYTQGAESRNQKKFIRSLFFNMLLLQLKQQILAAGCEAISVPAIRLCVSFMYDTIDGLESACMYITE